MAAGVGSSSTVAQQTLNQIKSSLEDRTERPGLYSRDRLTDWLADAMLEMMVQDIERGKKKVFKWNEGISLRLRKQSYYDLFT